MPWVHPNFDETTVNRAGETIRQNKPIDSNSINVVNNWRLAHAFPLNTIKASLRNNCHRVDDRATVVSRIKRFSSIRQKLRTIPRLSLYGMQDLGGARAILADCESIERLLDFYDKSSMTNAGYLSGIVRRKNFINEPKSDGYRSVHLIFRFKGRNASWDGLFVEVQIRTQEQHAWATTVEILETILKQRLRTTQGDTLWKRFLALMSSAIALDEDRPTVPGTPNSLTQIRQEVATLDTSIHVKGTLRGVINAITKAPRIGSGSTWTVLDMRPEEDKTSVFSFPRANFDQAAEKLEELERAIAGGEVTDPGANAVLVSVPSLAMLRQTYPNYYLDATAFLDLYDRLILGVTPSRSSTAVDAESPVVHRG